MNLIEIIDEIRRRHEGKKGPDGLWEKQQCAAAIGIDKSALSGGRMMLAWEKHWAVIKRILDMCDELGIDARAPQKAQASMSRYTEDQLVAILYRLLLQENPRPKEALRKIVERATERAEKKKQGNPHTTVPSVSTEDPSTPRKTSSR